MGLGESPPPSAVWKVWKREDWTESESDSYLSNPSLFHYTKWATSAAI
jgi:hypothetical protein